MDFSENRQLLNDHRVWIISRGRHTRLDLSKVYEGLQTAFVIEYGISDLARYLINPEPIEIRKKLIGCEIRYVRSFPDKVRQRLRQAFPPGFSRLFKEGKIHAETLLTETDQSGPYLKDKGLRMHIEKIRSELRAYDPILKRLAGLETSEISTIMGICEDMGGNRSMLNLKGTIEEKISYVATYLTKEVGVVLEKAHVSNGFFEMSGFDFSRYNPDNSHRLIKFYVNGTPRICVIGPDGRVEFWVEDCALINQMQLLEYSIRANPKFSRSLSLCAKGEAKALRLLFKKQLEIDYTKSPLPDLYRNLFETYRIETNKKNAIMRSLRNFQIGILFNYVPESHGGRKKPFTNVSVIHDVKALEPIKADLPEIYSIIKRMASASEAGRFYLLDSMKGYAND